MHYSELAQLHVCEILEGEVIHGEAGVRGGEAGLQGRWSSALLSLGAGEVTTCS